MLGFGRKTQETAVIEQPLSVKISVPAPISIEAELKKEERSAYAKLATEIGFRPAALIKDELFAFLQDNHFCVYPYGKVKSYLDHQFGRKQNPHHNWDHTWGWCPLLNTDKGTSDLLIGLHGRNERDNGEFEFERTYHGAVPYAVLDLVKNIQKTIPEIHFFVSDVMRPQDRRGGDPFLAVTTPGLVEMIIVAVWDEPSFRS